MLRASSSTPIVRPSDTINSTTLDLLSKHYVSDYIYTWAASFVAYGQHQKLFLKIANLGKEKSFVLPYSAHSYQRTVYGKFHKKN